MGKTEEAKQRIEEMRKRVNVVKERLDELFIGEKSIFGSVCKQLLQVTKLFQKTKNGTKKEKDK